MLKFVPVRILHDNLHHQCQHLRANPFRKIQVSQLPVSGSYRFLLLFFFLSGNYKSSLKIQASLLQPLRPFTHLAIEHLLACLSTQEQS